MHPRSVLSEVKKKLKRAGQRAAVTFQDTDAKLAKEFEKEKAALDRLEEARIRDVERSAVRA